MEFDNREYFVSRIMSDYSIIEIDGKLLHLYSPTYEIMYEANEFVKKFKLSSMLSDSEIKRILIERDLWTEQDELEFTKIIPDNLEKLKIGLYESYWQHSKRDIIKKYIKATNEQYNKLYNRRHYYDYITREGYQAYIKNQFIIEKCARYEGEYVDWSYFDIGYVLTRYHSSYISVEIIRELARTSPWASYWPIFKVNGKIFKNNYITLNQQQLVQWSLMYDNARESMSCPPDDVFEDDDMFDGWLIIQRRKHESEFRKKHIESRIDSNKNARNANEVFVVADSIEDAKSIDLLNDPGTAGIKRARIAQIKREGIVQEGGLSDVKHDLMMKMNQAYISKVKGG